MGSFLYALLGQAPVSAQAPQEESYLAVSSPDGSMVATVITRVINLQIWDTTTSRVVFNFQGFPPIASIAWSPDSRRIAAAGGDFVIRVWCVDRSFNPQCTPGTLITQLTGFQGPLLSITWSSNGILAAFGQEEITTLRTWNMNANYQPLASRGLGYQSFLAWNPQGTRLAIASLGGLFTIASDLQLDSGSVSAGDQLIGPEVDARSVAWNHDGSRLAMGTMSGAIYIFDSATENQLAVLNGPASEVTALAWNSDNERLAGAYGNGVIRIWDTTNSTWEEIVTNRYTWQISWSPDGSRLYYPIARVQAPFGLPVPTFGADLRQRWGRHPTASR